MIGDYSWITTDLSAHVLLWFGAPGLVTLIAARWSR